MKQIVTVIILVVVIAGGALAIRLPHLDRRPMHTDEAVNAVHFRDMLKDGFFEYNPEVRHGHGPTLFYLTLPSFWLSNADRYEDTTEITYRIVPVILGAVMILLLIGLRSVLGRSGTIVAGLWLALGPIFVFYSRYYIHETLNVAATLTLIVCVWQYRLRASWLWALAAGLMIGFLQATKQTSGIMIIAVAAGFLASCTCRWWPDASRKQPSQETDAKNRPSHRRPVVVHAVSVALLLGAAVISWYLLYSNFNQDPGSAWNSIEAYGNFFNRAEGEQGHDHPFNQYFLWLTGSGFHPAKITGGWWGETWLLVLAALSIPVIVCFVLFRIKDRTDERLTAFGVFAAVYTIVTLLAFCLIPYKTPWNALPFVLGMVLMIGSATNLIVTRMRLITPRALALLLVLLAVAHAGYQSHFLMIKSHNGRNRNEVARENPYIYGHSAPKVVDLAERIERAASLTPEGHDMQILVMSNPDNHWPLPWYFRKFEKVGWFPGPDPEIIKLNQRAGNRAGVIIVDANEARTMGDVIGKDYQYDTQYNLRHTSRDAVSQPTVAPFIRKDIWKKIVESN